MPRVRRGVSCMQRTASIAVSPYTYPGWTSRRDLIGTWPDQAATPLPVGCVCRNGCHGVQKRVSIAMGCRNGCTEPKTMARFRLNLDFTRRSMLPRYHDELHLDVMSSWMKLILRYAIWLAMDQAHDPHLARHCRRNMVGSPLRGIPTMVN
jgi:hypothetical protein